MEDELISFLKTKTVDELVSLLHGIRESKEPQFTGIIRSLESNIIKMTKGVA